MIAPAVALAWAITRSTANGRLQSSLLKAGIALCVAWGLLSYRQASTWRSNDDLFGNALTVNPRSAAAHETLGFLQAQQGESAADPQTRRSLFESAAEHYAAAAQTRPANSRVRYLWGNLLLRMGDAPAAEQQYAAAAELGFRDRVLLEVNWGSSLARQDKFEDALLHFKHASAVPARTPGEQAAVPTAMTSQGIVLAKLGRSEAAIDAFERSLAIEPEQPLARRYLASLRQAATRSAVP